GVAPAVADVDDGHRAALGDGPQARVVEVGADDDEGGAAVAEELLDGPVGAAGGGLRAEDDVVSVGAGDRIDVLDDLRLGRVGGREDDAQVGAAGAAQ